ncbi:MAG: radical SAM protein [Deltaproteobacteria bacterium]|nr:radical SAM protein [Deltaproteobacteria bacterium]
MSPSSFDHLKRLLAIGTAYRGRRTILPYFPSRLWVEATSHCNLRCPLCPNRDLAPEQRGFMSFDLFKKVVDQAAGKVHDLYLFHRGEPLLHPQLPEMIAYARERGIPARLHTNATLLTSAVAARLLEAGPALVSFSFDSVDEETYNRRRPPASFIETLSRIEQFLILKSRGKPNKMTTVLQIMVPPKAGPKAGPEGPALRNLSARLKTLGLDRVVVRRPHNWGGLIPTGASSDHQLRKAGSCTFPWYALVVYWDGSVGPCPQDFQGRMVVGRADADALTGIWNGPELIDLRERLARKDYRELTVCSDCDRPRRRQVAGVPLEYAWRFFKDQV